MKRNFEESKFSGRLLELLWESLIKAEATPRRERLRGLSPKGQGGYVYFTALRH